MIARAAAAIALAAIAGCSSASGAGDAGPLALIDGDTSGLCIRAADCDPGWSCVLGDREILPGVRVGACTPPDGAVVDADQALDAGEVLDGELIDVDAARDSITVPFPLETTVACAAPVGGCAGDPPDPSCCSSLGPPEAMLSQSFYAAGSYLEADVDLLSPSVNEIELELVMRTAMCDPCALDVPHTFDVMINGTTVGSYAFTMTEPCWDPGPPMVCEECPAPIAERYTFAPIAGGGAAGSTYTIRIAATSTVCGGSGGTWQWRAGGTLTAW